MQTRNINYYYFKNITKPSVIQTSFSVDYDTISFDLKSVYPTPSLLTLTRTNTYHRTPGRQSVIIQDKVKFNSPTNYSFGIPSKNGFWNLLNASSNSLTGKFTVSRVSLNVRVNSTNSFTFDVKTKTELGLTYTRLGISMINPIMEDLITITFY